MVNLRPGERFGPYRVIGKLAEGGFANIYRAKDVQSASEVALKVPAMRIPNDEIIADFRREVHENRKLGHPNVLPIVDHGILEGVPFIVTPLGRTTLADYIDGKLPLAKVLRYAHEMLLALAHAHARHVLHCDVKPDNFIVLPGGRLALADFGLARRGKRTVVGDGSGTPGYMAPEQARGRPSARSDVYSAGIVIATLLFGPLRHGKLPVDHSRTRRLPPGLIEIIERAIDPDPLQRFRDAGEMLAALRRIERRLGRARARRERGGSR